MRENTQEIKAIVSDLDGTIIKKGEVIPNDNFFRVVEEIIAKDIPFVIASGRQYLNLKRNLAPIASKINYIAENGCLIRYNDEFIFKSTMDRILCMELLKELQKEKAELLISGEVVCYLNTANEEFIRMVREDIKNDVQLVNSFEEIEEEILKIAIWWEDGIPEKEEKYYKEKYEQYFNVVDSGNGWLDFNGKGSGKGEALTVLAEKMGLSVENFIAFGDNENDISLLKTAGKSYAVSSAKKIVQESADYICENVEDELERIFL